MYYELYIDVLFLVNFTMDYLLLLTVRRILKCTATHFSVFKGAVLGALFTCAAICIPGRNLWMKFILFHIVTNTIMIRTGLKIKERKKFLQAFFAMYISGFFLGGVMQQFHRYLRTAGLFVTAAAVSYEIAAGSLKLIAMLQRIKKYRCQVTLYLNGIPHTAEAIIDTGNRLCEPETGAPVHIISRRALPDAWKCQPVKDIRFLAYHSIGKENGMLPVIRLEKMYVKAEQEQWVNGPFLGISEENVTAEGAYDLILNPDIF